MFPLLMQMSGIVNKIIVMKQKYSIFIPKKAACHNTKPITKKQSSASTCSSSSSGPSYHFKSRKHASVQNSSVIPSKSQTVLTVPDPKLLQIYETCRYFRVSSCIYYMAITIYKKLRQIDSFVKITSVETLACLTLAIKFDINCLRKGQNKLIDKVIQKCGFTQKGELIGAEIYVLQKLNFRLPFLHDWQQIKIDIINKWNQFIENYHSDKMSHFIIDNRIEHSSTAFQNFLHTKVITQYLLTFPQITQTNNLSQSSGAQDCDKIKIICCTALQISMTVSKAHIYIDLDFKQLFKQFHSVSDLNSLFSISLFKQDNVQHMGMYQQLLKLCQQKIKSISILQYQKYKKYEHNQDPIF